MLSGRCRNGANWRISCPRNCAAGRTAVRALAATFAAALEMAQAPGAWSCARTAVRPALPAQSRRGARVNERAEQTAADRGAAVRRRPSRCPRRSWPAARRGGRHPGAAARTGRILCRARGQSGRAGRRLDIPHRARPRRRVAQRAPGRARNLSRAAVETLAVIAYHQPMTRAEIEAIRGVALGRGTLDRLMEAGWVAPRGRRGNRRAGPLNWVTTPHFLAHFGLDDLAELPGVEELRAAGLLDIGPAVFGDGLQPPGDEAELRTRRRAITIQAVRSAAAPMGASRVKAICRPQAFLTLSRRLRSRAMSCPHFRPAGRQCQVQPNVS